MHLKRWCTFLEIIAWANRQKLILTENVTFPLFFFSTMLFKQLWYKKFEIDVPRKDVFSSACTAHIIEQHIKGFESLFKAHITCVKLCLEENVKLYLWKNQNQIGKTFTFTHNVMLHTHRNMFFFFGIGLVCFSSYIYLNERKRKKKTFFSLLYKWHFPSLFGYFCCCCWRDWTHICGQKQNFKR